MFDSTKLRFSYTSLITPMSVFDYDMVTRSLTMLKQTQVRGGYDPSLYHVSCWFFWLIHSFIPSIARVQQTERRYATARDGTQIPICTLSLISFTHLTLSLTHPHAICFNPQRLCIAKTSSDRMAVTPCFFMRTAVTVCALIRDSRRPV